MVIFPASTTIYMLGVSLIKFKKKPDAYHYLKQVENLYCQYRNAMMAMAIKVTHDRVSAEDVVQSVFARLLEDKTLLDGLKDETRVRSYLTNSAYNAAVDYLRSNSMRKYDPLEDYVELRQPEDTESKFLNREAVDEALQNIQTLKYHYSETLRLLCIGFSIPEIAKAMHVSDDCVRMRITRARRQLQSLARKGDDHE